MAEAKGVKGYLSESFRDVENSIKHGCWLCMAVVEALDTKANHDKIFLRSENGEPILKLWLWNWMPVVRGK